MLRALLVAAAAVALAWWLTRPRPGRHHATPRRPRASAGPACKAVRTFRTPGGVATTVYEFDYGDGHRHFGWWCDCGSGTYESDRGPLHHARGQAIRHHETHQGARP